MDSASCRGADLTMLPAWSLFFAIMLAKTRRLTDAEPDPRMRTEMNSLANKTSMVLYSSSLVHGAQKTLHTPMQPILVGLAGHALQVVTVLRLRWVQQYVLLYAVWQRLLVREIGLDR